MDYNHIKNTISPKLLFIQEIKYINWRGIWTLYKKEVTRFLKVYNQTLFAPVVSSLTFLFIFVLALQKKVLMVGEIPFQEFMAAGLIIMAIMQNAFANTSSVLVMGKVTGNIADYLIPPFSPAELVIGLTAGGITRGIMVGSITSVVLNLFVKIHVFHLDYLFLYIIFASSILSLLGILAGMIAESFDQMGAITAYVITPLSFLSGTFYSVNNLPPILYQISHFNPFFYIIDGFRYSLTNLHEGELYIGITYLSSLMVGLFFFNYIMLKMGWRIKS